MLILIIILNLINQISASYYGDATTYGGHVYGGSCGFRELNLPYHVAMNSEQYGNSLSCGKCVAIRYGDKQILAQVVDICPECKFGDLDLTTSTWNNLISKDPSRYKISWEFSPCPNQDNIILEIDEINYYWLNIRPKNFIYGIKNIYIKLNNNNGWNEMTRNDHIMMGLYFNYNGIITTPFKLKIVSEYNETIETDNLYSIEHVININKQFTLREDIYKFEC